jgi:hypothetical protein
MKRLLLAWLAAFGVVAAGLVVDAVLLLAVARHVETWPLEIAGVLLVHVPWVLTMLLATLTAVRLHGSPRSGAVSALAAFGVPALVTVVSVASGAAQGAVAGGVLAATEAAAGTGLAWWLTHRGPAAGADSYFAH